MEKIPYHIAIIPDGNRRWAKKNGLPSFEGHKRGIINLRRIGDFSLRKGVKIITFFGFSTENWKRSKIEINYLMRLFKETLQKYTTDLQKREIKFQVLGDKNDLPSDLRKIINESENLTKNNKNGILNIALNYSGREEIVEAVKKVLEDKPSRISEQTFKKYLWTNNMPDPDIIIRTGKEKRMSNFLLWELAYSELYFSRKYWPDFTPKDLSRILKDFSKRERRFGK